jgi:hypothetical protein
MNANLRPMNLGEILDRTFQIYRANFWAFIGIAALPALVILSIHIADISWLNIRPPFSLKDPGSATIWSFLYWLGFYHLSVFLSLLIYPAFAKLASGLTLGEMSTVASSLRFTLARWRSYLWVAILKPSVELLIPEILTVSLYLGLFYLAYATGQFKGHPVILLLLLVTFPIISGVVILLWFGAALSLVVPACALEQVTGTQALRRSWALTKGSRLRILAAWLMIVITSVFLSAGLRLLLRWVIWIFLGRQFQETSSRLFVESYYALYAVVSTIIAPIYPIALTLFYYDQRIRLEGYDIERMMEEAGLNAPVTTPAEAGEGQA